MKVAILTPTYHPYSGIDRVVEEQAKNFEDVTIFTLSGEKKDNVVIMGMPKSLFWQRVYRLFFFLDLPKIIKYIKQLKEFDVIYSHLYPMNVLAWLSGKKYIYYNHGVAPTYTFNSLVEKIYIVIFNFLNNLTAKPADEIISISHYLNEILFKEIGKKGRVVHNKIDASRFQNPQPQKVKDKYNISSEPVVLYIGRISPHKGVGLLIKAFNKLPQGKLIIVGKHTFKDYSEKLKKIANNRVIFTGFVPDEELADYYSACDVYATATLWEGFDLPLIEAQYFNKPVVAFDIGPHPELVKPQDILVPVKDVDALAQAILKKISNE